MCGIFGMYGKPSSAAHDKWLKDAMFAGTLRGAHASGVAHMYYDTKHPDDTFCNVFKGALPGTDFVLDSKMSKGLITSANSLAVIGHNRYATGGGRTDDDAHPFQRGHITMVHNGVIDNEHELLSKYNLSKKDLGVSVDSDVIACALSVADPKDVLESIEGAYALVWHNADDNTLNFARNAERPMWFAVSSDVTLFGSEKGMLGWLADRNDIKISEYIELPVGKLASIKYAGSAKPMRSNSVSDFSANARKKYQGWAGYSSYADSCSPSRIRSWRDADTSVQVTNLDNNSYSEVIKRLTGMLANNGLILGSKTDMFVENLVEQESQDILTMCLYEAPKVRAVKHMYRSPTSDPSLLQVRTIERSIVDFYRRNKDRIITATVVPTAIVLTSNDWQAQSTIETYESGNYKVLFDSVSVCFYALDDNNSYVEIFNAQEESAKKYNVKLDCLYALMGIPEHQLAGLYKNSNLVRTVRTSPQNAGMVVVTPINNKSATILVPIANLQEVQQ